MAGNTRKASRALCVHEAAHAFTSWYLGFRVDFAEVYRTRTGPVAPQIAGRMAGERIVFDLTPEQAGIASVPLREWYLVRGVRRWPTCSRSVAGRTARRSPPSASRLSRAASRTTRLGPNAGRGATRNCEKPMFRTMMKTEIGRDGASSRALHRKDLLVV